MPARSSRHLPTESRFAESNLAELAARNGTVATFFGGGNAGLVGAILLIVLGVFLLIQSIRR